MHALGRISRNAVTDYACAVPQIVTRLLLAVAKESSSGQAVEDELYGKRRENDAQESRHNVNTGWLQSHAG